VGIASLVHAKSALSCEVVAPLFAAVVAAIFRTPRRARYSSGTTSFAEGVAEAFLGQWLTAFADDEC
jgi:hypothetical protein